MMMMEDHHHLCPKATMSRIGVDHDVQGMIVIDDDPTTVEGRQKDGQDVGMILLRQMTIVDVTPDDIMNEADMTV